MNTSTKKPRLRLAPSPTGFLHLGNFRSALFGYLLAKRWQGDFILRIEDTDTKREVAGAVDSLLKVLETMGVTFDEGPHIGGNFGPYVQSERLELYRQHAENLVTEGKAYYCFATAEELEEMRNTQAANHQAPRYDRRYRDLPLEEAKKRAAAGEKYVIRQKMPLEGSVTVRDELRGEITFPASELEDHVLLKSDGGATYQLASVVDDHIMGITHVTRGDEWLPSLPKNILLYQAFGWEAPVFIHLPLILNKTGGKLSKRQGDVYLEDYLAKGYLPAALINFCVLLGWHPKGDQEIFSLSELEQTFTLEGIGTSPAIFDLEKLDYYNGHYLRQLPLQELALKAKPFLQPLLDTAPEYKRNSTFIEAVVALEQPRMRNLAELSETTAFFFQDNIEYDPSLLIWKKLSSLEVKNNLDAMILRLEALDAKEWSSSYLEEKIIGDLKEKNLPLGDHLWPLRVALSGRKASPGPFEIASLLGKDETLARIKHATSLIG